MEISQLNIQSDCSEQLISNFVLTKTKIDSQQKLEGCSLAYTDSELQEEFGVTINRIDSEKVMMPAKDSLSHTESIIPDFALTDIRFEGSRKQESNCEDECSSSKYSLSKRQSLEEMELRKDTPTSQNKQQIMTKKAIPYCYASIQPQSFRTTLQTVNSSPKQQLRSGKASNQPSPATKQGTTGRNSTIEKCIRLENNFQRNESADKAPTKKLIGRINEPNRMDQSYSTRPKQSTFNQTSNRGFMGAAYMRAPPKLPLRKAATSNCKGSGASRLEVHLANPISLQKVLDLHIDSRRIEVKPKPQSDRSRKVCTTRSKFL